MSKIYDRLGYWAIILTCIFVSVFLEVQNREYEYNNTYLRVSNTSWAQQNYTLRIICQNLMDNAQGCQEEDNGPL